MLLLGLKWRFGALGLVPRIETGDESSIDPTTVVLSVGRLWPLRRWRIMSHGETKRWLRDSIGNEPQLKKASRQFQNGIDTQKENST